MGSRMVAADGPLGSESSVDGVLAGYRRYLFERGVSETTAACYERRARLLLSQREGLEGLGLDRLTAADVSDFLARECSLHGGASAQLLVVVVRSVLRYLHLVGLIAAPLEWAVPAVAGVRGRSLPRGVSEMTVSALLSSRKFSRG
jgi:integrase/recombinase XerD